MEALPADAQDTTLACAECTAGFAFTVAEQTYFAKKGFSPPTRCAACRAQKRTERARTPVAAHGHKGGAGSAAAKKKSIT